MEIIINQNKFLTAIRAVERVASKNPSLAILNSILLKTKNGRLRLSATNLEIGINFWVGAKINKDGEIALPARTLSDFIGNISDEKITLTVNKNSLHIESDHYKTTLLGMETSEFPIIPKVTDGAVVNIPSAVLKEALISVVDSSSLSESRPELAGVYVKINNSTISFAATDGFRLAEKVISTKTDLNHSFILPKITVLEMIKLCDTITDDVILTISENQIFVYSNEFELISRLVDGKYPDYKKVIPERYSSTTKIDKSVFEKNIKMASIFSSSISDIKLITNKDTLEIQAKNNDKGEILTSLSCETKPNPYEIAVNYKFLLDGLKSIPSENVLIHFTKEGGPLLIKSENKNIDQTYVIMPLRNS